MPRISGISQNIEYPIASSNLLSYNFHKYSQLHSANHFPVIWFIWFLTGGIFSQSSSIDFRSRSITILIGLVLTLGDWSHVEGLTPLSVRFKLLYKLRGCFRAIHLGTERLCFGVRRLGVLFCCSIKTGLARLQVRALQPGSLYILVINAYCKQLKTFVAVTLLFPSVNRCTFQMTGLSDPQLPFSWVLFLSLPFPIQTMFHSLEYYFVPVPVHVPFPGVLFCCLWGNIWKYE